MKIERLEIWEKNSLENIVLSLAYHQIRIINAFNLIIVGIAKLPHVFRSVK